MALNKAQLETRLKAANNKASLNDDRTPQQRRDTWAEEVSAAMDEFVKTATVNVNVVTTGTATSHTGTGTGGLS